jgi:hypothetical protein
VIKSWRINGRGICHLYRRREMLTLFWWGKPEGKNWLEDLGVDGRIKLNGILKK